MNIAMPANLYALLSYIEGPLSFNYLEQTNLALMIFNIDTNTTEYEPFNDVFADYGRDTKLAAVNMQDTVIFVAIFIFGLPTTWILRRFQFFSKFRITKYLTEKFTEMFLYGFIIRLVVENFMAIFISCVLNFMEPNRSTYGEITSLIFAIGLFIAMFVIIFSTTFSMFRNRNTLSEDQVKNEIGSFYEDLRVDTMGPLFYTPIYVVRRMIFCILILTIPDYPLA